MDKRVYIETYGCQMNENDSELVHSILIAHGFRITKQLMDADVVLLNTCAVREHAERKVLNAVHRFKTVGEKKKIIGILGCMATHLKETLISDSRFQIDFIVGPDSYQNLPALIQGVYQTQEKVADIRFCSEEMYDDVLPVRKSYPNAWVTIMRGCDNFCAYCVVPYTRGRERSRNYLSILEEIKQLVDSGFKQVVLLGQNVNSYNNQNVDFVDLIDRISQINGLKRIRFFAPHPKDFSLSLLDLIAERKNICNHIHLPIQSGNTEILKKMNRPYSKEAYLLLVSEIKKRIPSIVLTTDIIVGFPTETATQFEDTVDVMKKVQYSSAYIFKYSPRAQTVAYRDFVDDVTDKEKTRRIVLLNDIQKEISYQLNQSQIGTTKEILIEKQGSKKDPDCFQGRNDQNQLVIIPNGPHQVGDFVTVTINSATPHVLRGSI